MPTRMPTPNSLFTNQWPAKTLHFQTHKYQSLKRAVVCIGAKQGAFFVLFMGVRRVSSLDQLAAYHKKKCASLSSSVDQA